jgi:transposase
MPLCTVRSPTGEEREELNRVKHQEVGRVSIRAHIIPLSDRDHSTPETELHNVTDPMVYKQMERFDEEGPSRLYDRDREGRPPKIDEEAEAKIEELLESDPTEHGENASRWTTPRIVEHLRRDHGIDVHPDTVRDALRRLEYSWTRPRRQLPSPADFEEQMARVRQRISAASNETTVLFADETELKGFPPLRRMWQPVGKQRAVWVPDSNDDFVLYGALDIGSGRTVTRAFEKERSDYTIQFLKLLQTQTTGKVLLIWDRATWHTSGQVESFLEKLGRFETHLLPPRSPEVNPVEDLWREPKKQVAACLERSLGALVASCRRYFDRLSTE